MTVLLAPLALLSSAAADDFYKDKTIKITVGFPPGGGFDANGRLLARYIGRYIPGHPDVIVVNTPGAASATSVAHLDVNTPTDGTVIDEFNFGLLGASLMQPDKTPFDFRHYAWIGSIAEDTLLPASSGAKTRPKASPRCAAIIISSAMPARARRKISTPRS